MGICRTVAISSALAIGGALAALPSFAAIPASERAVLDTLYKQTQGPGWTNSSGWSGTAGSECSWYGVICDTQGAHVVALNLSGDNLRGPLPALGGLSQLQLLYAGQNALTGSIPALSSNSQLVTLYLDDNQLTGTIPDLGRLLALRGFVVKGNRLSGSVPSLTGLSNLQYFDVSDNRLVGRLPALSGLANLQYFDAEANQIGGAIPALANLPALQYFDVGSNQLVGHLPALAGLATLQYFGAEDNQLSGPVPALTGLVALEYFDVGGNQLTGSLPSLSGLYSLETFEVDANFLTGRIPTLAGLTSLEEIDLSNNGFTGEVPAPPTSLQAGGSSLCNNAFNHTANTAWDAATASTPWFANCNAAISNVTLSAVDTAVATGTRTTLTAKIATAKSLIAAGGATDTGTVSVTDDQGNIICYIKLDATGTGSCDVLLPGGSTTNLTGGYSGTPNIAPASTQFSKTTPMTVSGNLDQHGWTGTWYNPATSGQGIVFEIYPDIAGIGNGLFGGGWFTFDTSAGGEDKKRWYTLTGGVTSSSASATLDIISPTGGNFNAAPVINAGDGAVSVGHATIGFSDCMHGNLSYSFTDGSGRVGNIPLTRLDANVTCDPNNGAGNGTAPGKFLLSGAWYTPSTSGQGVLFDINPLQNITVAAWYTYAPNGQSIGGGASQRWYTLQIGSANVGASTLSNIGIFSAQGGVFDAPGTVTTPQVGTASIVFGSCSALTLNYNFTSGSNAGQSGNISLQRVGPVPTGCSL